MSAYMWKTGSRIKADPNEAAEQFAELSRTGDLNAERVVNANRPKGAVLHGEFEWNDKKAAFEWQKHQARHLMNSLCVIVEVKNEKPQEVRALFTVRESKYEPLNVIFTSQEKTDLLLARALRELDAFKRKYYALKQLAPVFDAISEVTK